MQRFRGFCELRNFLPVKICDNDVFFVSCNRLEVVNEWYTNQVRQELEGTLKV